nr:hypothetical protein Iba_chr15eCG6310 [Ipomoea batatas]
MGEVDNGPSNAERASGKRGDDEPGKQEYEYVGGPHPRLHRCRLRVGMSVWSRLSSLLQHSLLVMSSLCPSQPWNKAMSSTFTLTTSALTPMSVAYLLKQYIPAVANTIPTGLDVNSFSGEESMAAKGALITAQA